MGNPYFDFWNMMNASQGQAPLLASVGHTVSSEPLRVRTMGLVYEPSEIQLNAQLPREELMAGDKVFCVTGDGWQTILILCKVVAA